MLVSLVIPCYNEENNIIELYERVCRAFEKEQSSFAYELIYVNDGSRDRTLEQMKELHLRDRQHVAVIDFSRNFGKEAAILAGMKRARGEYISIIDADLQQKPEIIMEMLHILEKNRDYDCVAAYQKIRHEGRLMGYCKQRGYRLMNRVCETEMYNGASDFRTMRRVVAEAVISMPEYYRFSKGIFAWIGFNTCFLPYEVEQRKSGASKWGMRKLLKYAMEGFFSFSTFPLRIATYIGAVSAVLAILYLVIVVIQKLAFSIDIPGYPTIIVLILFLGGMQLMILGLLGEYLARTYIQGKNRPIYIEKEYDRCTDPSETTEKRTAPQTNNESEIRRLPEAERSVTEYEK